MLYCTLVYNLNFKSADGRRWAQMKGERVHFEPWMGGYVKDMYRLSMWLPWWFLRQCQPCTKNQYGLLLYPFFIFLERFEDDLINHFERLGNSMSISNPADEEIIRAIQDDWRNTNKGLKISGRY